MPELPKWVNTILTNEFEDDPYWIEGIERDCPEAFIALSNLQQRPSDVNTYVDAMAIYNKYIPEIIEYYGGQEVIDAYFKETGEYPPGYILPPKLRMKKKNINFARTGYVPPKVGQYHDPVSIEEIAKAGEAMFGVSEEELNEDIVIRKPPKELKKRIKKMALSLEGRRRDILNSNMSLSASYDIISQFYEHQQTGKQIDTDDYGIDSMSISELARLFDVLEEEENQEWVPVRDSNNTVEYRNNRLVYMPEITSAAQWADILYKAGFDKGVRKFLKTLPANKRKEVRNQVGITFKGTKQLKKSRKSYDRYMKALNKKQDSLRSLGHLLSNRSSGVESDIESDTFDRIVRRAKKGGL